MPDLKITADHLRRDACGATIKMGCARPSWRVPAGASPAQERGSARLVASVAARKATTAAKRTQQLCGVWE